MASVAATARAARAVLRPRPERTVFFLCDIQERFRELIYRMPTVIHTASTLVRLFAARESAVLGAPGR